MFPFSDKLAFAGFKVIVNNQVLQNESRFVLSEKLRKIMNPQDVKEFDQWSRKFFGVKPPFLVNEREKLIYTTDMGLALMRDYKGQDYKVVTRHG